jgi:uridylate kinase
LASSNYKRILLKISGESFSSQNGIAQVVNQIKSIQTLVPEIAIVVGGGNVLRGRDAQTLNLDRIRADGIGMLATVISGLLLEDTLERSGLHPAHLTALNLFGMVEPYTIPVARSYLDKKRILVLSGGIGSPFFSTDTAAALRACELRASALFKGTKVDGVYSADPLKNRQAKRYERISYGEAITKNLQVMDATAFSLCGQEHIPIVVFNILESGSLKKVILGKNRGTVIC